MEPTHCRRGPKTAADQWRGLVRRSGPGADLSCRLYRDVVGRPAGTPAAAASACLRDRRRRSGPRACCPRRAEDARRGGQPAHMRSRARRVRGRLARGGNPNPRPAAIRPAWLGDAMAAVFTDTDEQAWNRQQALAALAAVPGPGGAARRARGGDARGGGGVRISGPGRSGRGGGTSGSFRRR
jgi:hypothetical protein